MDMLSNKCPIVGIKASLDWQHQDCQVSFLLWFIDQKFYICRQSWIKLYHFGISDKASNLVYLSATHDNFTEHGLDAHRRCSLCRQKSTSELQLYKSLLTLVFAWNLGSLAAIKSNFDNLISSVAMSYDSFMFGRKSYQY